MNVKTALKWYHLLTGEELEEKDLGFVTKHSAAVKDILAVATMVERAGGQLRSRQVISTIILNAHRRCA